MQIGLLLLFCISLNRIHSAIEEHFVPSPLLIHYRAHISPKEQSFYVTQLSVPPSPLSREQPCHLMQHHRCLPKKYVKASNMLTGRQEIALTTNFP